MYAVWHPNYAYRKLIDIVGTSNSITETAATTVSIPAPPNIVSSPSLEVGPVSNAQQESTTHDGRARDTAVFEATGLLVDVSGSGPFADYKPAFEAFQARIAEVHTLEQQEQDVLLTEAFQECCPTSEVWMYTTRVFRHVLHRGLNPQAILSHQATSNYTVPYIHSEESLDMLWCLERFMHQYPHCIPDVHRIHVQLAKVAEVAGPSNPYLENRVLKLVQQLWLSAHLQGVGRSGPILELLHSVANNCNNTTCRATLTTIFSDVELLDATLYDLTKDLREQADLMVPAINIVTCIPHEIMLAVVGKLTRGIAKRAIWGAMHRKWRRMLILRVWLQLLHTLDDSNPQTKRPLVDTAFTTIVEHVFSFQNLNNNAPLLLYTCLIIASQKAEYKDISPSTIDVPLHACYVALKRHGSLSFEVMSGVVMSEMVAKCLPSQLVVQMIVDSLAHHASLESVREFLKVLERRRLALVDATSIYSRISHQLATIEESTGASTHENALLHTCHRILHILSEISKIPDDLENRVNQTMARRRFRAILEGAQALKLLPLRYCIVDTNMSGKERNVLVHQIAHQYSTNAEISQKEAWRAIYRLYQYLQQESLPIGPLFSKAVVRASITRPLSENQFVSARRLIWVYRLVEKVEGEDVAKKLEADFWQWRGDLIKHAKSVHDSIGGIRQEKAHIGTMKKLGLL